MEEQRPIAYFICRSLAAEIARLRGEVYGSLLKDKDKNRAYRKAVSQLVNDHCNLYGFKLMGMDTRPRHGTIEETHANKVYFPYGPGWMLEQTIEELRKIPDVEPYIIKMLEDSV